MRQSTLVFGQKLSSKGTTSQQSSRHKHELGHRYISNSAAEENEAVQPSPPLKKFRPSLKELKEVPSPVRQWTDEWRPQRAADVLGNQKQAMYLRDWLKALQITADQAPVVRSSQSKHSNFDNVGFEPSAFAIGRSAEEEAWFDQFRKGGFQSSFTPETTLAGSQARHSSTLADLRNVLVLVGPSGAGKTTMVYSCATELGFEVFELYPGMGRRSGKDVASAVGSLGKNHMVSSGGTGGGAFRKASKIEEPILNSKDYDSLSNGRRTSPRQSLILLEEVDILFADDKGFWSAITELAAESRRPIILTCNDLSMIPLQEISIHRVLEVSMPTLEDTIPYIQSLAKRKGHQFSLHLIEQFCRECCLRFELQQKQRELCQSSDGLLHPNTCLEQRVDLRQTIMQLQFSCSKMAQERNEYADHCEHETPNIRFSDIIARSETYSFADSHLKQPFQRAIETLEPDQYEGTPNDTQLTSSWFQIHKPFPPTDEVALPLHGKEEDYYSYLTQRSPPGCANEHGNYFDERRLQCSRDIDSILSRLLVPPNSRVPSLEAVCDYAPVIRSIIRVDDAEEEAHEARINSTICQIETADGYDAASDSLVKLGIRVSRNTTKLLLQQGSDGLLQLARREMDFSRWLLLDSHLLHAARRTALVADE